MRYSSKAIFLVVCTFGLLYFGRIGLGATFTVDASAAHDDNGPGTPDRPFRTIGRATHSLNPGDTVLIRAGVYREAVDVAANGTADQPITIAAAPDDEGKVIITGSDRITDWHQVSEVVFTTPWTLSLESHYPPEWLTRTAVADYGPYAKRCEMVFINGKPLREVLGTGLMERGTFAVDETRHLLRIALSEPSATALSNAEAAVRQQGISVQGNHLILRGLTVTHVANPYFKGAMDVRGDDNVIENCNVSWNNLDGMHLVGKRVRATKNVCDFNGETGMSLTLADSRLEQNQTNDNAWRFGPGWAEGGAKIIGGNPSGNVFIGHVAKNNRGSGIWLDTCGGNNRVERCWLEGNMISGLDFEACVGDGNVAINNVICKSRETPNALYPQGGGTGVLLYESGNITLCNNTIVDNEHSGITLAGGRRGNGGSCANERIYDNIIARNGATGMMFWVWGPAAQAATLRSDHTDFNLWDEPGAAIAILPGGAAAINTLADWQKTMRQGAHSVAGNPQFISADGGDYHLQRNSLAHNHGSPAGESGIMVNDDFDGHPRAAGHAATLGAFGD